MRDVLRAAFRSFQYAAAMGALAIAALVASAIPARRAASVDPLVALRAEWSECWMLKAGC